MSTKSKLNESLLPENSKKCSLAPSLLSRLTLWWVNSIVYAGSSKTLTVSDLSPLAPSELTESASKQFNAQWKRRSKWSKSEGERLEQSKGSYWAFVQLIRYPGVVSMLFHSFRGAFLFGAALTLLKTIFQFVSPQLLKILIGIIALGNADTSTWNGISVALLIFTVSVSETLLDSFIDLTNNSLTIRLRAALTSAIYRKSLSLSSSARKEKTTGELINLMRSDAEQVASIGREFNQIWPLPFEFSITLYFLWVELGPSMIVGIALLVAMFPINAWTTNKENALYEKRGEFMNERTKVINEVLGAIKLLKIYAWEVPFMKKIAQIHGKELEQSEEITKIDAYTNILWSCSSFLVTLATFSAFIYSSESNVLNAQKVFVSMHLFRMLKYSMISVPYMISEMNRNAIAVRRLTKFLNAEEIEQYVTRNKDTKYSVKIVDGTFSWEKEQMPTLSDVNVKIAKGSLVAVVGHVGSGKSSLLSAILGDMERVEGTVNVAQSETIAYVAQQAWIQNATLRDNVLFGADLIDSRYNLVLSKCALKPDIAILPAGDQTEIGEKGINLSGGQKQRVALARACYTQSSLFLLDDPLAAVDSHVAKHIFKKVLSNLTGFLKNKTRILVTNNLSFLPQFDQIIVLVNGRITETGTYQELMSRASNFARLAQEHSVNERAAIDRQISIDSQPELLTESADAADPDAGKLIEDENIDSDNVKFSVFLQYIKTVSWIFLLSTLILMAASHGMSTAQDIWLAIWSSGSSNSTEITTTQPDSGMRKQRLLIYGLFGVGEAVIDFIESTINNKGAVASAMQLHATLLNRVMQAPMKFFDTTPTSRILDRFEGDINDVGTSMMYDFRSIVGCFISVFSNVILIAIKTPYLLFFILPISGLYYYFHQLYTPASRQLSRLRTAHRTPIHTHFDETLSGTATIRAFDKLETFSAESDKRFDVYQRCDYSTDVLYSWKRIRLQFCGNLVELCAAIFAVLSRGTLEAGFVSLIISNANDLTRTFNWVVSSTISLEKDLLSMEKINQYCEMETEKEWTRQVTEENEIPDGWPEKGEIEFVDYSVRYREGLDFVLKDVNVKIGSGEKVGIVGRTGAGKSSLTLALFRILEADKGQVIIDGIDTSQLGLHELRQRLAIIPQDPVLFSGTIRSNLDPFGVYRDELLLEALTQCHMRQFVDSTEQGLDHSISENGSNLSLGQRQLICLGRALLRRTKILILDEATAAIDLETDALIQQTIRREFADCTVLTIAHRLHSVMDSTKVMVMDQGRVVEFDSPTNLLANTKSMFYLLAKDAQIV